MAYPQRPPAPQAGSSAPQPVLRPMMPPVMVPSEVPEEPEQNEQLTDDEFYMEQLRKENLLRTVKEMKAKQIFLFEIFVDSVEITKENELLLGQDDIGPLPPLRVRVKFGNIPCFDIYEEEMLAVAYGQSDGMSGKVVSLNRDPQRSVQPHGQWRSTFGKSCLFFMIPMELISTIQSSPINVNVYRTVEEDYEHPTSSVGHTRIRLEDDFVNCVLRTGDEKTELPVSGYQSHIYTIHNLAGEETGKIDLFIRLSCFGNMISTQFQSLQDGREYVFKHSPGKTQLDDEVEKDLPGDYRPPKLLGKTDLNTFLPVVVSEENLLGVGNEISKVYLRTEMMFPKTVLWKECKKTDGNKCNCACLSEKYSDDVNSSEPCICNISETCMMIEKKPSDESSVDMSQKKCYCKAPCACNKPEEVNKCFCMKCNCGDGKSKEFVSFEPTITRQFEYEPKVKNPESTVQSISKTISKTSLKKLHLIGAGDSEVKGPTTKKSSINDTQVVDKNETKKPSEDAKKEIKITISSMEMRPKSQAMNEAKTNSPLEDRKQSKKKGLNGISRKISKRLSTQFDYSSREYPGLNIGHQVCVDKETLVPETMGWLWNIEDKSLGIKLRKGWRPGAIGKSVTKRICISKKARPTTSHDPGPQLTPGRYKIKKDSRHNQVKSGSFTDLIDQPPTFRLQHTGGKYFLRMSPIKEEENPDEDQKPVEIQVMPEEREDSLSDSTATSDTSIEVVFTCPGALRRKIIKPTYADTDTQYVEGDMIVPQIKLPSEKLEKKSRKGKGKVVPPKATASQVQDNLWEEQQTQMSLQKKKDKK